MKNAHGHDLRKGRFSQGQQIYLVTAVTQHRLPVFSDWKIGRKLVHELQAADREGMCSTLAFVVMPDHFHWLLALGEQADLSDLLHLVKGRSSREIGRVTGIRGIWQQGFHDHAARFDEDIQEMARYVVANPLRAGLVQHLGDYPLWDAIFF
ncbi:REP-associated tyrosine transposase [Iodobacter ciconiae]|uniref:Transposase n=1 Tax=Iodobacter ciconiae TaxID=2496266 RepID=A0A3S8ZWC3_9NEIS|nr:transposase [Iodobacter ciconiae]AZN37782.1 transposase [Iodobacter ciconiae]